MRDACSHKGTGLNNDWTHHLYSRKGRNKTQMCWFDHICNHCCQIRPRVVSTVEGPKKRNCVVSTMYWVPRRCRVKLSFVLGLECARACTKHEVEQSREHKRLRTNVKELPCGGGSGVEECGEGGKGSEPGSCHCVPAKQWEWNPITLVCFGC